MNSMTDILSFLDEKEKAAIESLQLKLSPNKVQLFPLDPSFDLELYMKRNINRNLFDSISDHSYFEIQDNHVVSISINPSNSINHINLTPQFWDTINYFPNLQYFAIHYCQLQSFHLFTEKHPNIKGINLSHTTIISNSIVESILKHKSVIYLDLTSCNLKKIPEKIKDLVKLKYLSLAENKINDLPSISLLKKLRILDLNHNELTKIRPDIFSLPELEYINFFRNPIKRLPFTHFKSPLKYINLKETRIKPQNYSADKGIELIF
jgi:Leucine-rich repeat (LRR) protein